MSSKRKFMQRKGFSLVEALVAMSVASLLVGTAVVLSWSTFRPASRLQVSFDQDLLVHKILQRLRTDLAFSNPLGTLFQTTPPTLYIRRAILPDANGSSWGSLSSYRLEQKNLRRTQVETLAQLDAEQAFPPDATALLKIWESPPTLSASGIDSFQVLSLGQALNIEIKSGSLTYRSRVDFQL